MEPVMFKRIDHVEIVPADLQRTIDFYTNILGFTLKSGHGVKAPPLEEVVYLTLGDTMVELLRFSQPGTPPTTASVPPVGYHLLALEVDDMAASVQYLRERGVVISWGPTDLPTSRRAEIQDPDGLPIELRQWLN
jgi:glyoxylase I family protein